MEIVIYNVPMEKKKNIVLVSDNHGLEEPIRFLQNRYASYDYFFHCGDYTLPKEVMKGFAVVRGNNDYRDEFPLHRTIHVGNHTFLLTHGYMDMFI